MPSAAGTSPKLPFKDKANAGLHCSHSFHYLIWEFVPRVGREEEKVTRLEQEESCPFHSVKHSPSIMAPEKAVVWMPAGGGGAATCPGVPFPSACQLPHQIYGALQGYPQFKKYSITAFFNVENLQFY